jgi:putative ATP-dependent endonuclease of OLD family
VFVSENDLEDEYCRALGVASIVKRLVAAGVARDERAIIASCKVANVDDLTPEGLAAYCRSSSGSGGGSRKVPAALAVAKYLTKEESEKITSVHDLLSELMKRTEA